MDRSVIDPACIRLVAGIHLASTRPHGFALVPLGFTGHYGHRAAPIPDLGPRVSSQVEVPGRRAVLAEPGPDDRDVVARRHADEWHLPPLTGAHPGRCHGD